MMIQLDIDETIKRQDDKLYAVESIIDKRRNVQGTVEYRVRWRGYAPDNDTWEPSSVLYKTCSSLLKTFNKVAQRRTLDNTAAPGPPTENGSATKLIFEEINNNSLISVPNSPRNGHNQYSNMSANDWMLSHSTCSLALPLSTKFQPQIPPTKVITELQDGTETEEPGSLQKTGSSDNTISSFTSSSSSPVHRSHTAISVPAAPYPQRMLPITQNQQAVSAGLGKRRIDAEQSSSSSAVSSSALVPSLVGAPTPMGVVMKKPRFSSLCKLSIEQEKLFNHIMSVSATPRISCYANSNSNTVLGQPSVPNGLAERLNSSLMNLPNQHRRVIKNGNIAIIRQSNRRKEAASKFRDIKLRRNSSIGLTEIIIDVQNSSLPNSFNNKVLDELTQCLLTAQKDATKVVLLRSHNRVFSSGIDLQSLLQKQQQQPNAHQQCPAAGQQPEVQQGGTAQLLHGAMSCSVLAESMRTFLLTLLHFPKPVVAGVRGTALGLGCAILPLCDLVYASEAASFCMPYTRLNQTAEAGASVTFPLLLGLPAANQLLLCGRQLTSKEALNKGLVSEILFSEKFEQELLARCQKMCNVPSKSLEQMKCMIRIQYNDLIENTIKVESEQLVNIWKSNDFRSSAQDFVDNYLPTLTL